MIVPDRVAIDVEAVDVGPDVLEHDGHPRAGPTRNDDRANDVSVCSVNNR